MTKPAAVIELNARPPSRTLHSCLLAAERQRRADSARSLTWIVSAISSAAKSIAAHLRTAGLHGALGAVGTVNVQGERQPALDVIANELLIRELESREGVVVLGSGEVPELMLIDCLPTPGGRFAVLFDPLDGSSNLDVGGAVGTIFSIYEVAPGTETRLQRGRHQVAAGYVLYGPSTILVLSLGQGVDLYLLDPATGNFVCARENVRIPACGQLYSVNEANAAGFAPAYTRFLYDCRNAGYASRYAGAMVADVHRVLLEGGVFLHPPTTKAPRGKLRLMYEANPMAFIVEQAGGRGCAGLEPILEVEPESLHARVPVILGSTTEVEQLQALLVLAQTCGAVAGSLSR